MPKTPEDWMIEIENGLEYRRQFGREDAWNEIELSYTNDPNSHAAIGPNLIYSMGDSLLSSLTVPDPEILIIPEHPKSMDRMAILEYVDNQLIKKMRLKNAVEDATINSYLFGRAILKIGYDSEFGWSPYYDIGKGNQMMGVTFTQFNRKGERIESGNTSPGMPWVQAVSPHDIVVPWGTRSIEDAPWIAHRIIRMNDYIKADPKYKNTSRLEPQVSMESFMDSYGHVLAKDRRASSTTNATHTENTRSVFNVLWEIHDRMTGRIFVITADYDKYLRNTIDALQIGGLPFVSTTLVKHPRSFWSTPQAYYLGQIQNIQYDISLQEEKQRRITTLKFLMKKGVMSVDELNKLISGDVGAIGEVDTGEPLKDIVIPFPQGSQLDFVLQSNANISDARDAIGMSKNQTGEFSGGRHTARESTFVKEGSELRTSRRMNSIIDLYTETIRKVNQIAFKYWKLPRYAMVEDEWIQFTGEELEGEYLYDVTLSTKRNLSRSQRKVESIMLMAQLAQTIPGINIGAMKQYIMDASGDPAFEGILTPQTGQNQNQNQNAQGQLPAIPATGSQK